MRIGLPDPRAAQLAGNYHFLGSYFNLGQMKLIKKGKQYIAIWIWSS